MLAAGPSAHSALRLSATHEIQARTETRHYLLIQACGLFFSLMSEADANGTTLPWWLIARTCMLPRQALPGISRGWGDENARDVGLR